MTQADLEAHDDYLLNHWENNRSLFQPILSRCGAHQPAGKDADQNFWFKRMNWAGRSLLAGVRADFGQVTLCWRWSIVYVYLWDLENSNSLKCVQVDLHLNWRIKRVIRSLYLHTMKRSANSQIQSNAQYAADILTHIFGFSFRLRSSTRSGEDSFPKIRHRFKRIAWNPNRRIWKSDCALSAQFQRLRKPPHSTGSNGMALLMDNFTKLH